MPKFAAAKNWSSFLALSPSDIGLASLLPKFRGVALQPGRKRSPRPHLKPDVIYIPSCTNELFGLDNSELLLDLCRQAKISVLIPDDIDTICCGTPLRSEGMSRGGKVMRENNVRFSNTLSKFNIPVFADNSSAKLDESSGIMAVAHALLDNVIVPPNWGCCGFAGDRGLIHPELTESATRAEADSVKSIGADFHVSNNRTCEMAMSAAVGKPFIDVIQLLYEAIRR